MISVEVEQGSPGWYEARCGIPTASNFDMIVTTKGEPSKQREKYMYQLAGERVAGKVEETYQNQTMQRGVEMEAEAREFYELTHGGEVVKVGFCYPDEKKLYGASPDGLVGEEGLIEIKCPLIHTHVGYLLDGGLPKDYFQQVQGQLLVTGRKWCDFISYFPGLRPLVVRVHRDEAFIQALSNALNVFVKELAEVVERIR